MINSRKLAIAQIEKEKEKKGASKDLLRLEKPYFEGICQENSIESQKEYLITKLLQEKKKEKPQIGPLESSSGMEFLR